jgi:hypothetical protein
VLAQKPTEARAPVACAILVVAGHCVEAAEPGPGGAPSPDLNALPIDVLAGSVPAGVPFGRMPPAGSVLFTYIPVFTSQSGNLIGSEYVSPQTIAATVPALLQLKTGSAQTVRVVPTDMSSRLQLFEAKYGISDVGNVTVAGSYLNQSMTRLTSASLTGSDVLTTTSASTSGLGDTTLARSIRLYQDASAHVHLNVGLSLPTGSTTEAETLINPTGEIVRPRAPYGTQLGTGTVDGLIGLTYIGAYKRFTWGAAWNLRLPLDYNSHGYKYGALDEQTAWGGYQLQPGTFVTLRVDFTQQAHIDGRDPVITGFGEPADPTYHGGNLLSLVGGVVMDGEHFGLPGAFGKLEGGVPVYENLNGPQLSRDWQIILALSYRFGGK